MSLLDTLHRAIVIAASIVLLIASAILTYSVAVRHFLLVPTDWQEEASVFLIIGVTFLSAAWVQRERGHVAIEALANVLPPRINRVRLWFVDLVSVLFCAFFAWKSWTLLHEAVVEGHVSSSSWAPPLWIPYAAMSIGMTLLTLQILVQLIRPRPA